MDWITCTECEEEFRVITESLEAIAYCPLCGSDIELDIEDDEDWDQGDTIEF